MSPESPRAGKAWWQEVALWLVLLALVAGAAVLVVRGLRPSPPSRRSEQGWYQLPPSERLKALSSGVRR
ncbi:MAG: hypothetical protein ACM3XZ_01395 [Betaproteobacteria bacterium]